MTVKRNLDMPKSLKWTASVIILITYIVNTPEIYRNVKESVSVQKVMVNLKDIWSSPAILSVYPTSIPTLITHSKSFKTGYFLLLPSHNAK